MRYSVAMITVRFLPTLPSLLASEKVPFIHRDLSWLQFNERVLEEARQTASPLLERVKFLAITATNLDEFFMIRASSIQRALEKGRKKLDWKETQRLIRIRSSVLETVNRFASKQLETLELLRSSLDEEGLHLIRYPVEGEPGYDLGKEIFDRDILPKLNPPESFSYANLHQLHNLQSAVILPGGLWIRIPRHLPGIHFTRGSSESKRLYFFFLDDLIATHLASINKEWTPGMLRLTRDADFSLDLANQDPESIPDAVMTRIGTRERGRAIRLQYSGDLSPEFLDRCRDALKLHDQQILPAPGTFYLHSLWTLVNQVPTDYPSKREIRYPPLQATLPVPFRSAGNIFEKIRERDFLLHHPYDSFDTYVEWIKAACTDPQVESIEQTVYRMDAISPVLEHLKTAARTKRVRVLIELRARFDELNNLRLADELQKAGVDVAFGFGALKVHAKVALIKRRENDVLRFYTHLSTGNYHSATARTYTDLAILTANAEFGADAAHFFDCLCHGQIPTTFKQLVIAPTKLMKRMITYIQGEIAAAKAGKKARIIAKVNALVSEEIVENLYLASQAGVQVDLIVRGACSLIPGVKGLSENIRVISIVDRFLEHSRIYYFGSQKKMFLSSADWMPRNLFSRFEIAFPVLDPRIYAYLEEVLLPAYLSDTVKARELNNQGTWRKRALRTTNQNIRSQVLFRELAIHEYKGTPLER